MKIEKFHIYSADLNPRMGTEPGKIRPVVVLQTDLLNNIHPSTIVCPLTTKLVKQAETLRVHISMGGSGLDQSSDILMDQIRAIDNRRFKKYIGKLTATEQKQLLENLKVLIWE